jgi:hypothetical protein
MKVKIFTFSKCGPSLLITNMHGQGKLGFDSELFDVEENVDAARGAKVIATPTIIITDNDGVELKRLVGFGRGLLTKVRKEIKKYG